MSLTALGQTTVWTIKVSSVIVMKMLKYEQTYKMRSIKDVSLTEENPSNGQGFDSLTHVSFATSNLCCIYGIVRLYNSHCFCSWEHFVKRIKK
jgi:hypothetical protein